MALANAQPHESRLYYEFSHLYDLIFRRVFYPRIRMVVRSLDIEPGARVLELGSAPASRSTRIRRIVTSPASISHPICSSVPKTR
jgi:hypothetical protein